MANDAEFNTQMREDEGINQKMIGTDPATFADSWGKFERYLQSEASDEEAKRVERYLDYLEPKQREVLSMRFRKSLKQKDIGNSMGLSGARISQIQREALGILQKLVRVETAPFTKSDWGKFSEFLGTYFKSMNLSKAKLGLTIDEEVLLANTIYDGHHYFYPITDILDKMASDLATGSDDPEQQVAASIARSLSEKLKFWLT